MGFQVLFFQNYSKSTQQFQETHIVSAMKRDQSLLFTAVPEEGSDNFSVSADQPFVPTSKKSRPKFLNLKSISVESNSELKSTKPGPGTPFCGQRSVSSTPITELKKFVHTNPLFICKNDISEEKVNTSSRSECSLSRKQSETVNHSTNYHKEEIDVVNSSTETKIPTKSLDILHNSTPYVTITSNFHRNKKHSSLLDLTEIVNSISKDSMQYFSNKNKVFVDIASPQKKKKLLRCKSIIDPTFPVQKQDGTAISRWCYDECIANDLEMVQKEVKERSKSKIAVREVCQDVDRRFFNENKFESVKNEVNNEIMNFSGKMNKEHRKSLTLPLKSLATDSTETVPETSTNRRYSVGVQLTPLLSKLSTLAFEERSSGFCSRETTPCKLRTNKDIKINKLPEDALQKCVLFVCGQQDVVLMILLREEACDEPNVIKKLVSCFNKKIFCYSIKE